MPRGTYMGELGRHTPPQDGRMEAASVWRGGDGHRSGAVVIPAQHATRSARGVASRRRNLPRRRNVAALATAAELASTLAYPRGMPLRAPISRVHLKGCAQRGGQLRGQLGKGAETLTSRMVGTPFLRSPEHAWRCDQR